MGGGMNHGPTSRAGRVVQSIFELLQRRELEPLVALYSPTCRFEDMATGESVIGQDGLRSLLLEYWEGLPDFHVADAHFIESDPWVAVELGLEGTHRGTFLGYKPTGRRIRWRACAVYSVDEGLGVVNTETYYYDSKRLGEMLGSQSHN